MPIPPSLSGYAASGPSFSQVPCVIAQALKVPEFGPIMRQKGRPIPVRRSGMTRDATRHTPLGGIPIPWPAALRERIAWTATHFFSATHDICADDPSGWGWQPTGFWD